MKTPAPAPASQPTRANSFNYLRTTVAVPYAPPSDCTAHRAVRPSDLHRQVWLVEGERSVLYVSDTADFDAAEIVRVKNTFSHLFLDRARPGVLDDFTEGMRRVLPDSACDTCPNRDRCGRRFQVIEGPPFAVEEQWIASYMGALQGQVLDVGCGEQLYRDQLAPLLDSGTVQYTGLDPDELSLERIRTALPRGRYHLCGIEDFDAEGARYDRVISLRSLNHVYDVDLALERMASLLKPGGQLLLVECTPFAMMRRARQVAAADRAPRAGQQHFRNLASEEVLPSAARHFRVLHHHPAARNGTNQWILLLEKTAA